MHVYSIARCLVVALCTHIDAINSFHDHIIESCKIAMSVHIPHTNSGVCSLAKVIPGWDYEADCARE